MRAFLISVLTVSGATHAAAATVDSFDDLEFFVGAGANTATLVVDWGDGLDPLAWGYRFDGAATGEDMLLAIAAADKNFVARVGTPGSFGLPVYGLGYDRDGDGFGIDDGTTFGSDGLAVTGVPDADFVAAVATDSDDSYFEGWTTGFFTYVLGVGNPFDGGNWESAPFGVSGFTFDPDTGSFAQTEFLADGDFTGLAAAPGFTNDPDVIFPDSAAAAAPSAVVPEPTTLLLAGLGAAGLGLTRRRRD